MKNRLLIIATLVLFIATSCAPEKTKDANGANGFGTSKKPLSGTPWRIPSGVNLIFGVLSFPASTAVGLYHSGLADGTLPFYFTFKNTNTQPVSIIFPAGLMFPSPDTISQNGITLQADTITVPPSCSYYQVVDAYCMNDHRTFEYNKEYGMPIVTTNDNMALLLQIMATKQLVTNDPTDILQKAVWHISDSIPLTPNDIATINNTFR